MSKKIIKGKKDVLILFIIVLSLFGIIILYNNMYDLNIPEKYFGLFFALLLVAGFVFRIMFDEQFKRVSKKK